MSPLTPLYDGAVSYDLPTKTLTLNNAKIDSVDGYGIQGFESEFTLKLIGRNTIDVIDGTGIPSTGKGLAISNNDAAPMTVVAEEGGSLTINSAREDGGTVRAIATGNENMLIIESGDITIYGPVEADITTYAGLDMRGGSINIDGKSGNAIYCYGGNFSMSGGAININGSESLAFFYTMERSSA